MYRLQYLPIVKRDMEESMSARYQAYKEKVVIEELPLHIVRAAESLKKFPYIGVRVWPNLPLRREYRVLLVKKHMLFFTIDEEHHTVTIVRLLYGWKKYEKLLQ